MAHLIDKDVLVAEINQRIEDYKSYKIDDSYHDGLISAFEEVRDFINSLPEEPVSEDLEEAASKYCEGSSFEDAVMEKPAYIAGAKWQKEQFNR